MEGVVKYLKNTNPTDKTRRTFELETREETMEARR